MTWKKKLIISLVLIGGISYTGYTAYQSGWLEKNISEMSIPFQYLREPDKNSVKDQQIKETNRLSIQEYKTKLNPILSPFKDTQTMPKFDKGVDQAEWDKLLNPIYGVEYTYVGKISLSGFIQDKSGWTPLVTLSVYNDSKNIRNITVKVTESRSGLRPTVVRDTNDEFAYSELPNDFDMSLVDLALRTDDKFFEKQNWKTGVSSVYDEQTLAKLNTAKRIVKTQVLFVYSDSKVIETHKYGNESGIYRIERSYDLDLLSSQKNLMLVPMKVVME